MKRVKVTKTLTLSFLALKKKELRNKHFITVIEHNKKMYVRYTRCIEKQSWLFIFHEKYSFPVRLKMHLCQRVMRSFDIALSSLSDSVFLYLIIAKLHRRKQRPVTTVERAHDVGAGALSWRSVHDWLFHNFANLASLQGNSSYGSYWKVTSFFFCFEHTSYI